MDEKEAKFLRLTQRNMFLVEYECKFDKLARYTPYLVGTKQRKAKRFEKRLKLELYNAITVLRLPTYMMVFNECS